MTRATDPSATTSAFGAADPDRTASIAVGLIVADDGRLLLQHRDDKPGIFDPGLWGSFGGRIEPYETPDDGFLRELREELSWQPTGYELYASAPYHPDERRQLIYIYAAPVDVPLSALTLGE